MAQDSHVPFAVGLLIGTGLMGLGNLFDLQRAANRQAAAERLAEARASKIKRLLDEKREMQRRYDHLEYRERIAAAQIASLTSRQPETDEKKR